MCYSARIWHDYRRYVREYGATVSIVEFIDLFWRRNEGGATRIKIAKGLETAFVHPETDDERRVAALIDRFAASEATRLEQELFKQRTRLADAERSLSTKPTKKAAEDQRIAQQKIDATRRRLADLHRSEPQPDDTRIFPQTYAPVLVVENGQRVVKPMRYGCRLAGKPASHDLRFPGTYNARRDNLEGYWRTAFGVSHGIVVMDAFFENVPRHRAEGRALAPGEHEENVVLEFRPRRDTPMLVACVWSRWRAPGEPDLLSFAAITDSPPPEIAAAGHDRCVVPIKPEHLDAWLAPRPGGLETLHAILDDRDRPYYDHRWAEAA